MKTCLFVSVLLFVVAHIAYCDSTAKFQGDWRGRLIVADNGKVILIRIVIHGDEATQYFGDKDGWTLSNPRVKNVFFANRNNAILVWQHLDGVWSETQVFSLSYLRERQLDLQWLRHVNNEKESSDNNVWNQKGSGVLRKTSGIYLDFIQSSNVNGGRRKPQEGATGGKLR
jgi:hypothetical protein